MHNSKPLYPSNLKRWANLAALGWYSGDTHVHRRSGRIAQHHVGRKPQRRLPAQLLGNKIRHAAGSRQQGGNADRWSPRPIVIDKRTRYLSGQYRIRNLYRRWEDATHKARSLCSITNPPLSMGAPPVQTDRRGRSPTRCPARSRQTLLALVTHDRSPDERRPV